MSEAEVHLFVLSGRSGSGKTTIANEVTHVLANSLNDIPHVHIDGDKLDFIHPAERPDEEPNIALLNLQSLFRNYYTHRRKSCGLVLISGSAMIQQWREIQCVIKQVCQDVDSDDSQPTNVKIHGIILHASDSTAFARLRQREIGTDLERHSQSSLRIAGLLDTQFQNPQQQPLPVLHVHTDGKSVSESASLIVEFIRQTFPKDGVSRGKLEVRRVKARTEAEDRT